MKKSSFMALLLGTVSGVLFSLGMCMALLPEWDAFREGVIFGALGLALGAVTFVIWCRMEKKTLPKLRGKTLWLMAFGLVGVVILSVVDSRGAKLHTIIMIAMALYAFTKVGLGVWGMITAGRTGSPVTKTLRNISFADALVSIFSLQRSMLVSFPGLTAGEIQIFNALTGAGVCLLVCLLGINLMGGRYVDMAKSKLVQANEKIAESVVGGYKKIESAVVEGYTKIEDRFVDAYLTKDGETVEEAKARLKGQDK